MEQLKTIAEAIGQTRIAEYIRDHYGPIVFGVTIAIVVGVGVAMGYTPEMVMEWLGQ